MSFGLLTHDSTERDNRTDDGEEDEEDGCNALHRHRVSNITQVVRVAVLDIVDESAE